MEIKEKPAISVHVTIDASLEKVWKAWTSPESIIKWNTASIDWHTTRAENDLRNGGKFISRMEAKNGNFGFDFEGVYDVVKTHECIAYTLGDGRQVRIEFVGNGNKTRIIETFDAETINDPEMQRTGWQAILNSFKSYTESI